MQRRHCIGLLVFLLSERQVPTVQTLPIDRYRMLAGGGGVVGQNDNQKAKVSYSVDPHLELHLQLDLYPLELCLAEARNLERAAHDNLGGDGQRGAKLDKLLLQGGGALLPGLRIRINLMRILIRIRIQHFF
jgi:hypothetical protein